MPLLSQVIEFLKRFAPLSLAAAWDNVGLLLGDETASVRGIMTCLTVTPESAAEAIEAHASLIVSHHPILFKPIQRLTATSSEGRMLLDLTKGGMAVYSPHTAFDNCAGGINDILARRLGLTAVGGLRDREATRQFKIVVFVPEADLAKVSDALFAAGAGHIGDYSQCSFRLAGTGTFFGSESTSPTVGAKGRREEVSEWRLEVICPEKALDSVLAAMRRAHSYEEPAFDVYPLRAEPSRLGIGRFGSLTQPVSLQALAQTLRASLPASHVELVGEANRAIQRVAIVCGAGGEFVADAVAKNADLLITGEARFHDCLAAKAQGLAMILPGHYATERCGVEELAELLQRTYTDIPVWASGREKDPLQAIF